MDLTTDHVRHVVPDPAQFAAGQKIAGVAGWKNLGRSTDGLWGEYSGSALYQVRVDLRDLATKCSCPSRRFPCKHGVALMLLATQSPEAVPEIAAPDWVEKWLATRNAKAEAQSAPESQESRDAKGPAQQAKRAEKRRALVSQGIDGLDLWLHDLVRDGLAGLEQRKSSFWEQQAGRLVDCQAPGLAARVRRLAYVPGSSPQWPEQLLAALGSLALLTETYRRLDTLDPPLQADVRSQIGWTLKEEEVAAHGDLVRDRWLVVGQWVEDDERLRTQRTWLIGAQSGRPALVLQFSVMGAPFGVPFIPGATIEATLAYWPSNFPLRAFMQQRHGTAERFVGRLPGVHAIEEFLTSVSDALASLPWLERFPCLLRDVIPAPASEGPWQIVDTTGSALPLSSGEHWPLLAMSGGHAIDLTGEWQGDALLPLGL
ncbi:MAG: zinc finger family protein, partial [Chloroflexi bacterium]|nr:zinc finger family protein [Chloroflexota bacterium]